MGGSGRVCSVLDSGASVTKYIKFGERGRFEGHHEPSIGYKYNRISVTRGSINAPRMEPSHPSRLPLLFKNTAVKVEEDVLVMDGVVVKNPPVDRGRSLPSSLTDSGGSSSSLSAVSVLLGEFWLLSLWNKMPVCTWKQGATYITISL